MQRGTTPTLILNVTGEFDYSEVTFVQVTIRSTRQAVTYTKSQVAWDAEQSRMLIQMSQADTLALSGDCGVQMRYQIRNGNTFSTNVAYISFERILSSNVIGEDFVQVRMKSIEADLTPEPNEGETTIEITHGEMIEGDPRIFDIMRNGEVLPISEDGIVNIYVPENINDLQGSEEVLNALRDLKDKTAENTEKIASHEGRIEEAETAIDVHEDRLEIAESNIKNNSQTIKEHTLAINNKANASNVYTKEESDTKYLTEKQIKTINNKSLIGIGNITIEGMTTEQKAKLAEVDNKPNRSEVYTRTQADARFLREHQDISGKADKGESYTKAESDEKYLTEHQQLKTINGQSVVGEGNIVIEGGKGDVQSVSVNGGTPITPDGQGNIDLPVEGMTDEQKAELAKVKDKAEQSDLEATNVEVAKKANQSALNATDAKVTQLEQNKVDTISMGGVDYKPTNGKVTLPSGGGGGSTIIYPHRGQQEDGAPTNKLLDDELGALEVQLYGGHIVGSKGVSITLGKGVNQASGNLANNAKHNCTDYIPISEDIKKIKCLTIESTDALSRGVAFYNNNKSYINGERQYVNRKQDAYRYRVIDVPSDAKYIRLTLLAELPTPQVLFVELTDTELSSRIIELEDDVEQMGISLRGGSQYFAIRDVIPSVNVGIAFANGGIFSNTNLMATSFIPIVGLKRIRYPRAVIEVSSNAGIAFYDAENQYISGEVCIRNSDKYSYVYKYIDVPSNAVYIRLTLVASLDFNNLYIYEVNDDAIVQSNQSVLGYLNNLETNDKTSIVGAINSIGIKSAHWGAGGYEEFIIETM